MKTLLLISIIIFACITGAVFYAESWGYFFLSLAITIGLLVVWITGGTNSKRL